MGAVTLLGRRAVRRTLCALPISLGLAVAVWASPANAVLLPNPEVNPSNVPQWSIEPMMVAGGSSGSAAQAQLSDHGGPVLGATTVYLIYWDPSPLDPPAQWPITYPHSTKLLLARFLADVAGGSNSLDNPLSLDSQYVSGGVSAGNATGTPGGYEVTYGGSYSDQYTPYPASGCTDPDAAYRTDYCLTDAQIQQQLSIYVHGNNLPTGPGNVYLFLTPPDVTTCLDGTSSMCSDVSNRSGSPTLTGQDLNGAYCGYHSVIGSGGNEIVYGQIPWPVPKVTGYDELGFHQVGPSLVPWVDQSVPFLKDCQPDGSAWVNLPNETVGAGLQPLLSNDGAIEADFSDVIDNTISHVLNGIITDPNLNGYYDSSGLEAPDKCEATGIPPGGDPQAWWLYQTSNPQPLSLPYGVQSDSNFYNAFSVLFSDNDQYYLQAEFNQAEGNPPATYGQCVPGAELTPRFPVPASALPNQMIGFDSSSTNATMGVRQYVWNFGDGSPTAVITCPTQVPAICNPSTYHAFTTPGTYNVTLTVTDGGGYTAAATDSLKILGAAPAGGGSGSGSSGATSSSTTTTSTTTATTTTTAAPAAPAAPAIVPPKATQAIVASSVSKALRSGLVVHYSVTQQVAGHFEVLLDARTAKHLGIKGPVVKGVKVDGLSNPVEIGTALLETTKAGKDGIAITFSKTAAARLKHTRTLTLTVRLVAHNIIGQQVVVTTTVRLG